MTLVRHAERALAALVYAFALSFVAHADATKEWRFDVLLDNKPIGEHSFKLTYENGMAVLRTKADFNVKFLGFSAYRYRHEATEKWRSDCLAGIESQTSRNGEIDKLVGKLHDASFQLKSPQGETTLDGCVMSFAYWNPAILKQSRLLNAETGEYHEVKVTSLGNEALALPGRQVTAKRYRLKTSKFSIDLWYSTSDHWLALETKTEGGRTLRYVLEPAFYALNHDPRYA